jgi:hypothetical protein
MDVVRWGLTALAAALAATMLTAGPARAGEWMQVSCVNPGGTAAPSDGWTSFTEGTPSIADDNDTQCSPGHPMFAQLGNQVVAHDGDGEVLQYRPPAGSTLVGGTMVVNMSAFGGDTFSTAQAVLYEPKFTSDASDVFFACVDGQGCGGSGDSYSGTVTLPADRAGNLYASAICTALSQDSCQKNVTGNNGNWALTEVASANLLLSTPAAPGAGGFSGSALQPGVTGTGHLVFTASDAGGPGVYEVAAAIDGRQVFVATPDANGGECVPVGTDPSSGALMFDWQQPCPANVAADIPVPTSGLADGAHNLTVAVIDAARNTSTVFDQTITTSNPQTITTSNPQTTPSPPQRRAIHAQFVISWHWRGATTQLRSIKVKRLPRNATVTVTCTGRHCPRLRVRKARARSIRQLLSALKGRRLRTGDMLLITVTAPGHEAERIQLQIRANHVPRARLLTS